MAEGNFPLNDQKKKVLFNDSKENSNTTNAQFFKRGRVEAGDITDPNIILDESNPSMSIESHNYERLKSTRQQTTFKAANANRGFSPPVKLASQKVDDIEETVQMEEAQNPFIAKNEDIETTVNFE
jgi:hypothetical protein